MFSAKPFSAFLFDMDGTLISSIIAAEKAWGVWAERQGLDLAAFIPTIHGKRAVDTIRQLGLAGIDPEHEADVVTELEIDQVDGIFAIPGAKRFLESLPPDRWAVVTSAPLALARKRLGVAGLSLPKIVVTAEDVSIGKPAPDCYLLAAQRLGVDPRTCVAFEDAPAGITAARASGAEVVVITATHAEPFETDHATIPNYEGLTAVETADGLVLVRS